MFLDFIGERIIEKYILKVSFIFYKNYAVIMEICDIMSNKSD